MIRTAAHRPVSIEDEQRVKFKLKENTQKKRIFGYDSSSIIHNSIMEMDNSISITGSVNLHNVNRKVKALCFLVKEHLLFEVEFLSF